MFLRHRLSIRAQLLLLVLAVVLPGAGIFAYYVADESQEAGEAAYAKVKILADNTVASLDLILRDHEAVLSRLAERPLVRALDARNFDPVVGEFMRLHPEFNNLGVRDLHANNIYSNQPNPPGPQAAREFPWFQEGIRSGKFTPGNAFLGHVLGRWVSVLTIPVRDDEGKASGLLYMALDLPKLNERVFQHSPAHALQTVLDRNDKFLLRSIDPSEWIGKPLPGPQADVIRGRSAGFFSTRDVDGVQRLYAVETLPGTGWRVFAGLRLAGYVHDIGKISVPAELLSKPSRLTPMEFELIKSHSQSGHDVLKGVDFPWPVAEVILQHHERLDGSGYPRQLKDGEIILEARIMAVADVVEAMSSHRPYRPGLGMDAALEEIRRNSGKFYDPQVVVACLRLFRDKGYTLPA